jgi:integrase
VAAILPAHIADAKDKLMKEPGLRGFMLKAATIHRYLASVSGLFEWLLKEKHWIQENPVKKIRWPKVNNARERFLTEKEISNLLNACDQSRNQMLGSYVRIALLTGMRKGELLNLRWKNVDFERKQILLEETKNGDSRTIPMVGELKNLLHDLAQKEMTSIDMLLFPGVEDPTKSRDFQTAWKRALKVASIHDFTFHDLRHCAATIMLEAGVPHFAVARVLGHRLLNTTLRYSHLTEQAARDALEHISKKVEGLR